MLVHLCRNSFGPRNPLTTSRLVASNYKVCLATAAEYDDLERSRRVFF